MRWTSTALACRFNFLLALLFGWCSLLYPAISAAQTLPADQGQVADSTELRVLRQFYYATGGAQWYNNTNWLQGNSLSEAASWRGVSVEAGDVVSLQLQGNNLAGTLPASLGQLTRLRQLDFYINNLRGKLPASLGQLTQLQVLGLGINQFTGHLPSTLGNLVHLRTLHLNMNGFTGSLPAELGQLTELTELVAGENQLNGLLPTSFEQLGQLQVLQLNGNALSGPLPERVFQGLRKLTRLVLNYNHFSGSVPASLGSLRQLQVVTLTSNDLSGFLPMQLGRCAALQHLDVRDNQLIGSLPDSLTRLRNLSYLDASLNQLSGSLPDSIGHLSQLQTLSLHHNHFSGALPESVGTLTVLTNLDLSYNELEGALPNSFVHLQALAGCILAANKFSGSLPPNLGLLPLSYLDASNNQFSGSLPGSLGQCQYLRFLLLQNNQLSGFLPDSLGTMAQTAGNAQLYLRNNHFTGPLPASYARLGYYIFDVSHNELSGPIPAGFQSSYLSLDNNHFSGALPTSYGTAQPAQLTLQGNDLTQLPAFTPKPKTSNTVLYFGQNLLAFDSFEPNQLTPSVYQDWSGDGLQRQAPADTLLPAPAVGDRAQLDGRIGGAYNHYQWQRQVGGQWVDMPSQTQPDLQWATVSMAEAGLYRTRVINDWVVGLTLYSRPHYLDVLPYRGLAQNRPDDTSQNQVPALTDALALAEDTARTGDINFVRSWSPRVALTEASRVPQAPVDSVAHSTQYLDGLGRPIQTVLHQASPGKRDFVQPQAYDGLGREPRQYLPYPAVPAASRQGYHPGALAAQDTFYRPTTFTGPLDSTNATQGVARTGVAYAETRFEDSPLSRVAAQGAPGETWRLTGGHVTERFDRSNTVQDSVLRFTPNYDPHSLDPGFQGFYTAGELWGTEIAEPHRSTEAGPHGYRTIEWKDKQGQVVLKQVEAARTGTVDQMHSRWLRTAYAYDDFGRLRFVLQPEATKRVLPLGDAVAALPTSLLPYLFHYRYDGRGRQIAKQVPGQDGETLVVYDQLDRPVLSQDPVQRTRKEWGWTKYDALGRIILAGLVTRQDTLGQVSLQNLAAADTATINQYEQRTADASTAPQFYTTTQAFPKLSQQGFGPGQVLSVTRYDDYDFDNDGQPNAFYNTSSDNQFPGGTAPVADVLRTTGMVTQIRTRVLGVAEGDPQQEAWLTTTTFYDERARPVQVQTTNARRDTITGQPYHDLLTTRLDFTGKVVQSVAVHQGPRHLPVQVAEFFAYDHTGRLLTTHQQLPGETQPVLLASVQYNEIGQAVRKTLGTGSLKQEVDYAYNIRGWLTSLNDPYRPNDEDLFNLSLHYERGFTKDYEQYNGNLTGQTWRGRDGVQRAYGYVYDPLNRLLQGDFVARNTTAPATPSAGLWKAEEDNYRLSFVSYDDNGNILTLRRRGLLQNATHARAKQYGAVDNLTYAYQGNCLQAVDDAVSGNQLPRPKNYNGAPASLAGDFQEQGIKLGEEYLYDANGNLTQDKNKGITGIAYNHLNLPRQIHFGQVGDSIVFRYTASGQKVAKLVYQTGKTTPLRTDYLGPYQYEQDSLKFFPHAEGRVLRFVSYDAANQPKVSYQREFTFKDHLGNLRMAYRDGQVRTIKATLEQDKITHDRESQQFDSLSVSQPIAVVVPAAYSNGAGNWAARLNAGGTTPTPLGPLTQLGVQKGDDVTVSAYGFYPHAQERSFWFSLGTFLASLVGQQPSAPMGGDPTQGRKNLPLLQVGVAAGLEPLRVATKGVPLGYLRLLVFDKDSALVKDQTKQVQLTQSANGGYEALSLSVKLAQDGYVTAYVGNESDVDVYFDDVTVEHRQGLQVQETQYDPAGLELAGLAPPSPGIQGLNNYRFNGKEFQMDLGLAWNHQDWRFFDPQLLRWHAGDPELENGQESWTPYSFGYDNAVRYADADGREPGCPTCPSFKEVTDFVAGVGTAFLSNESPLPTQAREMNAIGRDANAYNTGLLLGDVGGLFSGALQTAAGITAAGGGTIATAGTAGAASPLSVPTTIGGVALAAHGISTWGKAANNLLNPRTTDENGRVNANGRPSNQQAPSVTDQATNLKDTHNGGKHSVDIKTPSGHTRYDLAGRAHGGVPTPHIQKYKNNVVAGVVKSVTRDGKHAQPMTKEDVRIVKNYLERQQ